jgi:hypothetical protein
MTERPQLDPAIELSPLIRNCGDVFGNRSSRGGQAIGVDPGQKRVEIGVCERPLERRRCPLIVALKGEESLFEFGQRRGVFWGEDLSLNNREVDLNLVEPARVDRSMDEDGVGPFGCNRRTG